MPASLIRALAIEKKAATLVNKALGELDTKLGHAIAAAADEVIAGKLANEFPLVVWQTGSGTQTNMNMNEVLANRASELLGAARGAKRLVHANDHVNCGQSSNDSFPTAMHIAAVEEIDRRLLPALRDLHEAPTLKAREFADVIKTGGTHLQDATAMTLGQEFGACARQIELGMERVEALTMAAAQVMGNHVTITIAGSQRQFELNVMPVIIYDLLQSIRLTADAARSFADHCVLGIEANRTRMAEMLQRSLMPVTRSTPILVMTRRQKWRRRRIRRV
jgi:fumarate hydratase class II